ncbi:MAG: YggS family pyridoxal phosphate-dependent enzyme [Clostridia bacterium]|nr:YggS family pyridoxal phosphate-dependent enzyme [Clostridia bacterium]
MDVQTVFKNVQAIKSEIAKGNPFGERVTLVAATKMQTAEAINAAIEAGVDAVAENKVQEFREKHELLKACPQHFIGHLQTNKVKYLVGKIDLYHSCDRDELAKEIARLSVKNGLVSDILIQINIGNEESKGGYPFENALEVFSRLSQTEGLRVRGFMAMLPDSRDEVLLSELTDKMRGLFDQAKKQREGVDYLSMGMSGDYRLCVEHGSNMIRVGSTIFGARDYSL